MIRSYLRAFLLVVSAYMTTTTMGIAHATTALDLYNNCSSQRDTHKDLLCLTYIDGAVAGLSFVEAYTNRHLFCVSSLPNSRTQLILIKFAKEHPESLGQDALSFLFDALRSNFPCPR